ncbi:2-methylcitrate dehydratase [Methylobacterium sp. Leaf125]|uniref:MmgE/PrpD family protein n=1 Tax=Methylobacterium sp. Leaf125 TaxID=1736265 RepID=UPI0006FD043E|nr:MmgE/PrpD family protein [Methylobacterium sp. Leaf125]KQQ41205.1 2-methylcitrate dehydratase [Methylobacterium sp. Leaf125]
MDRNTLGMTMHRRRLLSGSGAALASMTWPVRAAETVPGTDITGRLARYMVAAREAPLPPEVMTACKHRILDTFGAMLSGARMRPGTMAAGYVRGQGGVAQCSVVGTDLRTSAINAALANAMCAHADETDDFEPVTKAHPGSATVPAALGYDLCCRLLMALGPDLVRGSHRSAEGTSSTFGALGAASSLARLDEQRTRFALSYAAQQVSGLWSWVKDEDHIEKAFDFAGMGARNGVTAVSMVEAGLTGVADVLDGTHNLFIAPSSAPKPEAMVADLGRRFYVAETAIKTYSVGYPIQSPLDAVLTLRTEHGLSAEDVRHVRVSLPTDAIGIVGHSAMPDVSCQHLVALALVRGGVSFADSHDATLMQDPAIRAVRDRIELVGDPALMMPEAPRSARVALTLSDGRTVEHMTKYPPGTKENPLSTERVSAKVRDLIVPVIGAGKADDLIGRLNALETVADIRTLSPLLTA